MKTLKIKPTNLQDILNDISIIYNKYQFINQNIYIREGKYLISYILKYFKTFNEVLQHMNINDVKFNISDNEKKREIFIKIYNIYGKSF